MDRRPTADPPLSPSSEKRRKLLPGNTSPRSAAAETMHTTPHLSSATGAITMLHTLAVTYTNAGDSKQLVATPLVTRASDDDVVPVSEHMRVLKQALGDAQAAVNVFLTAAIPQPAGAAASGAEPGEDEDEDASGSEDGS
ncbi:hypothetical protein HDU87_004217 [Geranomyces variabilis]|uniref:EKC/KEOPS complex subunit GON7 n=1 Tax=Geranomyces variabilis TaxID=109894 RepID=A0AAD5TJ28_9FUNG|nr:hypothetical protein HDU87_004217 [Geranomyces variabilis]